MARLHQHYCWRMPGKNGLWLCSQTVSISYEVYICVGQGFFMQKDYKMFPPSVNWDNINWSTRRPQMDFPVQVLLIDSNWYEELSGIASLWLLSLCAILLKISGLELLHHSTFTIFPRLVFLFSALRWQEHLS